MKILAIDTSSKNATVSISENEEEWIELNNSDEKTHSQKLMPMIDEALKKAKLSLDNIELITCCLGPGSFTGVRIGIATAKAFADCKNIKVVGVSSLEVLAYNLKKDGFVCSLIDAGHGNVYAGFFKIQRDKNNKLRTTYESLTFLSLKNENEELSDKNLVEFLEVNLKQCSNEDKEENTIHFVGDVINGYEGVFQNLKISSERIYENAISGLTLAKIGYTKYKNGMSGASDTLKPIYLRKSQAELQLKNKLKV